MDNSLLARFAEGFFWMARYMERVENLARMLDVNVTFARNDAGEAEWFPIVQMQSDEEPFYRKHAEASAEAVLDFYLLDRENPNSVHFAVRAARENARGLRHLISLELWSQLNVFYGFVGDLKPEDLRLSDLSKLCGKLKEECQLHTGIAEGTLYRDQGWYFYAIGKSLERADQVTRLVDVKYNRMLPASAAPGSAVDASQWNALLRSAAAWHAYRRIHHRGMRPEGVVGFLLFNRQFPRSVQASIGQMRSLLFDLVNLFDVENLRPVALSAAAVDRELSETDAARVLASGLHDFLNDLQIRFSTITSRVGEASFFHDPEEPPEPPAMIQVQVQD